MRFFRSFSVLQCFPFFLFFSIFGSCISVFSFSCFSFLFEKVKIRDCKYNGDEGGKWWENLNEDDLCFPRISLLIGLPWNSSFFELPEQRQWSSLRRGNDLTWSDFWRGHALPHQPHPSPLPPPQKSQLSSSRQHLQPHHGFQYNISRYGGCRFYDVELNERSQIMNFATSLSRFMCPVLSIISSLKSKNLCWWLSL